MTDKKKRKNFKNRIVNCSSLHSNWSIWNGFLSVKNSISIALCFLYIFPSSKHSPAARIVLFAFSSSFTLLFSIIKKLFVSVLSRCVFVMWRKHYTDAVSLRFFRKVSNCFFPFKTVWLKHKSRKMKKIKM